MRISILLLCCVFFSSCSEPEVKPSQKQYIDLKGIIESEILKLNKAKARVNKTVTHNGQHESLSNTPVKWEDELALFIESDINKSAWQGRYKVTKKSGSTEFQSLDSSLRTKTIVIRYNQNKKPVYIQIKNHTDNNLYKTSEILTFIPDSVYTIIKDQKVILLGKNRFKITGKIVRSKE